MKRFNKSSLSFVFCLVVLAGAFFALAGCLLGYLDPYYLFYGNKWDIGMDFFNPVYSALSGAASLYPPLPMAFYEAVSFWLPGSVWEGGAASLRASWQGTALYILYQAGGLAAFGALVFSLKKGERGEKFLFLVAILFSAPFLFQFERANFIFPVLVLILAFLRGKDSPHPWVRQLALICLAAAGACKLYPLALGMVLVKEKRWKDILFLGVYTAALLLLPAFLYEGPQTVYRRLWNNMQIHLNYVQRFNGFGYELSASNTFMLVCFWWGAAVKQAALSYVSYIILAAGAVAAWLSARAWRVWALAGCLMVLVPQMSGFYSLILLFPAFLLLVDKPGKKSGLDWFCFALFLIIWIPIWLFGLPKSWYTGQVALFGETLVCRFAVLVLFGVLCAAAAKDGWRRWVWWRARKNRLSKKV